MNNVVKIQDIIEQEKKIKKNWKRIINLFEKKQVDPLTAISSCLFVAVSIANEIKMDEGFLKKLVESTYRDEKKSKKIYEES